MLGVASAAHAQSVTTGAIQGRVTDKATEEPLAGVTVWAIGPTGEPQTAITDEDGTYKITELPPGDVLVTFYVRRRTVDADRRPRQRERRRRRCSRRIELDGQAATIIEIEDTPPQIDPTSTTQGITIDHNYIKNIPVPGRTFESPPGTTPGSQNDGVGISFSGSTSLENQYFVDGVNTTGLTLRHRRLAGPQRLHRGDRGHHRRLQRRVRPRDRRHRQRRHQDRHATSSRARCSALAAGLPRRAARRRTPVNASSIDVTGEPRLRRRLRLRARRSDHQGQAVVLRRLRAAVLAHRLHAHHEAPDRLPPAAADTGAAVDVRCAADASQGGYADGAPDIDPDDRLLHHRRARPRDPQPATSARTTRSRRSTTRRRPSTRRSSPDRAAGRAASPARLYGLPAPGTTLERPDDRRRRRSGRRSSTTTRPRSRRASAGTARRSTPTRSIRRSTDQPRQILLDGNLGTWGRGFGGESAHDRAAAPTTRRRQRRSVSVHHELPDGRPRRTRSAAPARIARDIEERRAAQALGHPARQGASVATRSRPASTSRTTARRAARLYSGGAFLQNFVGPASVYVNRWVAARAAGETGPALRQHVHDAGSERRPTGTARSRSRATTSAARRALRARDVDGKTINWSAYLRDSWQIRPNLTLNAGLRYEEQRLRYAEFLREQGRSADRQAARHERDDADRQLCAPRLGLLYDWTKEGRSKIYGSLGPLLRVDPDGHQRPLVRRRGQFYRRRSRVRRDVRPDAIRAIGGPNGDGCLDDDAAGRGSEQLIGASGVLVAPGIKSQYMDEVIAGFEYEVMRRPQARRLVPEPPLGRVIEDVSTDGANTYIIANPGEWSAAEEQKLAGRRSIAPTTRRRKRAPRAPARACSRASACFDKPRRDYNALQFTLTRRFSKRLYVQGSYTYSRTDGNYPGLISYDNGQVDPNISSQYDLIELLGEPHRPAAAGSPALHQARRLLHVRPQEGRRADHRHPPPRAVGHPDERARVRTTCTAPTSRSCCRAVSSAAPSSSTASTSTSATRRKLAQGHDSRAVRRHLQHLQPPGHVRRRRRPTRRSSASAPNGAGGTRAEREPGLGRHVRGSDLGQDDRQRRQRDARSPIGAQPELPATRPAATRRPLRGRASGSRSDRAPRHGGTETALRRHVQRRSERQIRQNVCGCRYTLAE